MNKDPINLDTGFEQEIQTIADNVAMVMRQVLAHAPRARVKALHQRLHSLIQEIQSVELDAARGESDLHQQEKIDAVLARLGYVVSLDLSADEVDPSVASGVHVQTASSTVGPKLAVFTGEDYADPELSRSAVARRLPDIVFDDLLSSDEIGHVMRVSRPTVLRRLREGALIGWLNQAGSYKFPAGQLDRYGNPIAGIALVLEQFSDPQVAWEWVLKPQGEFGGRSPLEFLRAGRVDEVVDVANGQALGAFG
ncbi:hypothetical protein [Salinisphaera aquimarina]|uniref:Antitoxin Xre/MbcA/ParS-like toxin-binding domain-containing protein n=1 Tax=Salinisphaera aquimarina TaxID=2094031 RepID=A0ABV7ESF1_9GAMM